MQKHRPTKKYLRQIADRLDAEGVNMALADEILQCIETSKIRVQQAFLLRMQGRTFAEIAEELGVDKAAVFRYFRSNRMSALEEALRAWILEYQVQQKVPAKDRVQ